MAIDMRKDECIKRISGTLKVKSKLFLNPVSNADKNELQKWMKDVAKGNAFLIVSLE